MSFNIDDYLVKITEKQDPCCFQSDLRAWLILRAVVELHKPLQGLVNEPFTCQACRFTIGNPVYPCPTIQVIEKELKMIGREVKK